MAPRALITGDAGFIGSHLADELLAICAELGAHEQVRLTGRSQ